jgi:multidrug efflux pump subunit AcrB
MIEFFTRHPTAANLLLLFLCVLGISALPGLQRETFPRFDSDYAQVQVIYPGAGTEDVEEGICQRVEEAIDGINDVEEITCEAREGVGSVRIEMSEGGDFGRFMDDIKSEVEAISNFPDEVEIPTIKELNRTDRVVAIAVTGPMSTPDLKAYAEQLKERMQRDSTISLVEVAGFSAHQLRIEISETALLAHGLSISDIAQAISRQGIDLPAGNLETAERDYLIRFTDLRRSVEELNDLAIIASDSGGEIRLGDIAKVSDRFALDEEKTLINGHRAALLQVLKTKKQDTLVVRKAVDKFLEQARQSAPPGVEFTVTQDRSSIVEDRLNLLVKNGLQGLAMVFLVMWLFFQGRFAFWVAFGLPVSFLGALWCMSLLGLTINMITMVALLIAIGLLMDDAIVIAENIATKVRDGMAPYRAAVEGASQVAPGVLSSFFTSLSVFGPLAFLSGHMGKVLQFIPMVLLLVLTVSLIEAFLILPRHLAHSLSHRDRKRGPIRDWLHQRAQAFRDGFDDRLMGFRDNIVGPAVDWSIHNRYLFLGAVVGLFLLSIGMVAGGKLKFQIFPDLEGDTIEARLLLPQGTPLWRTEQAINQLNDALERVDQAFTPLQSDGRALIQNIQIRYNSNADANESGPHLATVSADLITAEERNGRLDDIIQRWREETGEIHDAVMLNFKEPVMGPGGLALEMRLSGRDLEQLKQASLALQEWFSRYPGVQDLSDDLRPGKPELRLSLRDGALALGIDASTIASQLRTSLYGTKITEIQVGPETYEIDLRMDEADRVSITDLEEFRIITPQGNQIPLSAVVNVDYQRGFSRIQRINGLRTVTVQGDLDTRKANAREIVNHTRENFLPELQQRFPQVRVGIEGQARESAKTGQSMARAFGIGLVGIFILLSFQFRSYVEPIVVMILIPFALMGVIWGHLLMGLPLSMPGIIGFTSLAGIVVNDSILLVAFLKHRVAHGMQQLEAAKQASRDRFRAILLTSITTIAGLTPLLLEKSMQAQILIPLATSIIFGLLASTLLVLFVVPAFYSVLHDMGATSLARDAEEREKDK